MPTYTYETIPQQPGAAVRRFDVRQSMSEPPLTHDPETGAPVQRVISGGRGPLTSSHGLGEPQVAGGCGGGCACHN
ncbi:MAG: zinc ribbon domain-containing protein [Gemmatimonadales bacterium]|nr:zinc ribbon domain-containing protein [Gemmatimonadales bacterium]